MKQFLIKNKWKTLYVIIIIVILLIGYIIYETIYLDYRNDIILELIGEENITLNLEEEYTEEGAKATFREDDITNEIKITSNVDTTKVGEYQIYYDVTYKNKEKRLTRTIKIVDTIVPILTLNGAEVVTIYENSSYTDSGVSATDNYDGDITDKVIIDNPVNTSVVGNYTITYLVKDSSGNETTTTRQVKVIRRPVPSQGIAVLNYHFFYAPGEYCGQGICLSTVKFEQQLQYLKNNGYKTLTMSEFVDWMYGKIQLPKKSVLLTIDDGAMGTGLHNGNKLIPLLEKYGIHATLFLVTGWWDISNYQSEYLDVESHSNDMHNEGFCSGVTRGARMLCSSYDVALADLQKSIEITKSNKAFCYPFYVYNNLAIKEVQDAGFKVAFAGGNYKATRNSNKYAIPRYVIYDSTSLETFINYIS